MYFCVTRCRTSHRVLRLRGVRIYLISFFLLNSKALLLRKTSRFCSSVVWELKVQARESALLSACEKFESLAFVLSGVVGEEVGCGMVVLTEESYVRGEGYNDWERWDRRRVLRFCRFGACTWRRTSGMYLAGVYCQRTHVQTCPHLIRRCIVV